MQPEDENNWTLTYADMMSLLLCFFVMLYALSTIQETKFETATESLRGSFGLFGRGTPDAGTQLKITKTPKRSGTQTGVSVLFESGKDELSDTAKEMLNGFARQILQTPQRITITGRTVADENVQYRRDTDLAYSRCVSVCDYLVSQGIAQDRFCIEQTTNAESSSVMIHF
ncbi:hypothetical protein FACS189419_05590 [Planctomycetales bacterium]|nr:hypothetical protein FACS189419_05590 [Planctomycetales bacterium]